MMLKIKKLIVKKSLARERKRIKNNLRETASLMIFKNIFYDGFEGYLREIKIYGN